MMARKTIWNYTSIVFAALLVGLSGCLACWDTAVELPTLIVGPVMKVGAEGYVLVSVANMPDGGLAAIQFGKLCDPAITYSGIVPDSIRVQGRNGFEVLLEDFTTAPCRATLLAVSACVALVDGEILKFTFTVTGANPTFEIPDASKVTLGDASYAMITGWNLDTTSGYYTKSGQ